MGEIVVWTMAVGSGQVPETLRGRTNRVNQWTDVECEKEKTCQRQL